MKYKAIAKQIIADIQNQKLTQGQQLPSLRQLTKQLNISMTTALNSYRHLEQMGWVVTRPKSGFFVAIPLEKENTPKQPQFRSSSINVSNQSKFGDYKHEYSTTSPFGISQLCPEHLPLLSLKRSIKRTAHQGDKWLHSYSDPQGVYELRQAISNHFNSNGFAIAPEELFISNGCMDAVRTALLATTQVGDAVAISSPCFNGLLKLLSSMGRRVVEIPCNSDGLDLLQFEQSFKSQQVKAALFSSSHMNPHGISLSMEQKQKVAKLANKHRIPIIEDDVYGELGYDNTFSLPIKYWDSNGYVLWCTSVSKTLASGLRIGWCAAGRYLDACINISATEHLGHNGIMQASLADFINAGQYRKHLQKIRKTIFTNICSYRHLLLKALPRGTTISAPNGGLVLWVQVANLNPQKLKEFTDEAAIDIRFGAQFTTRKLYRDCFRLNTGWPLDAMHNPQRTIEQALHQLAAGVHSSLGE